jgi:hypothetical protein
MALFYATVEVRVVFEADSIEDAVLDAPGYAADELKENGGGNCDWVEEVGSLSEIPKEFENTFPWGGDGARTVKQILDAD